MKLRLIAFRLVMIAVFGVFLAQLWQIQIARGEEYRRLADQNRFRLETLEAPRGVMYDRSGTLLVQNAPAYQVFIIPAYLPEERQEEILGRLSALLDVPLDKPTGLADEAVTRLAQTMQRRAGIENARSFLQYTGPTKGLREAVEEGRLLAPYNRLVVKKGVSREVASIIEEEHLDLPGVLVEVSSVRHYEAGELDSKILGYVGPVPQERVEEYQARGYAPTDQIGLTGLELYYEDELRGIKGLENVEVDAAGRKVRTVGSPTLASPGHNLVLTLDLDLQRAMEKALVAGMKKAHSQSGVAIAMNPKNGEILGMVSLPTFDSNLFSSGISAEDYTELSVNRYHPLVNQAISAQYPPGSTYKIIPAAAALQEGVVTTATIIYDPGVIYVPNKYFPDDPEQATPFYCWLREGHKEVSIVRAIAESCDIFFYELAGGYEDFEGLGLERLGEYSRLFGLGEPAGIDLPGEAAGLVPSVKWKRLNYGEVWVTGDTYNMGIGQGYILVTPLQLLNATAAIANGGTLYRPHLVSRVVDSENHILREIEPQVIRQLPIDPQNLAVVRDGLWGAVNWGTANELQVPGISAAGKTGTAEFCDNYPKCLDREGRVRTSHAWFTAFAPVEDPEIALAVFVYGGGEGSLVAVPIAGEILRHYFGLEPVEEKAPVEAPPGAPAAFPLPRGQVFRARLLGADSWTGKGAALFGRVLDIAGDGIPDALVALEAGNGQPAVELRTGTDGVFTYDALDPQVARQWTLRLVDYPGAQSLLLDIVAGQRYLVQFEAITPR
jgi:penicillin-binding protein 2